MIREYSWYSLELRLPYVRPKSAFEITLGTSRNRIPEYQPRYSLTLDLKLPLVRPESEFEITLGTSRIWILKYKQQYNLTLDLRLPLIRPGSGFEGNPDLGYRLPMIQHSFGFDNTSVMVQTSIRRAPGTIRMRILAYPGRARILIWHYLWHGSDLNQRIALVKPGYVSKSNSGTVWIWRLGYLWYGPKPNSWVSVIQTTSGF